MAHQGEATPPEPGCCCLSADRAHGKLPIPHLSINTEQCARFSMQEPGRSLERFTRRIERLRLHHNQCERRISSPVSAQVQEEMALEPTQLDNIHENSDFFEFELSSHTGSDPEYNPPQTVSSSSDEEDLKSPECEKLSSDDDLKGPDTNLTEDEDQQRDPASTSESVPHRGKRGREDDEDEGSDLSSSQIPDPCTEREGSDIDDQSSRTRLPPKKKKLKKAVEEKIESPTSTFESAPHRGKRGRRDDEGEGSDLSSTQRPDPCAERASSDTNGELNDQSSGRRLPPKKKNKLKKPAEEKKSPKVKGRRPWSESEKNAVHKHLARFMAERKVPGKTDCMQCVQKEKALAQRSWKDVKNFVHNTIVTLNRRSASRILEF